jgi:uncharacterized membrane protein
LATILDERTRKAILAPSTYERILSVGAVTLLVAVVVALAKGFPDWPRVPWQVWPHLVTIMIALVLTPVMLLRRRGDARHRLLGRIWAASTFLTAALSFNLRGINDGQFSLIHLLSAFTLVQVPLLWWSARTHRVATHRRIVLGLVTGALLVAGFFTFPFGRLLGSWLFS